MYRKVLSALFDDLTKKWNLLFLSKSFFSFTISSNCNNSFQQQELQSDTDELLKNEELEPTIQQPSANKRKKKYLGRINYKVCTCWTI